MIEVRDDEVRDIMAAAQVAGFWKANSKKHYNATFKDTKAKLEVGWSVDWANGLWIEPSPK